MAHKASRQTSLGSRRASRGGRSRPAAPPRRAVTRARFPIAVVGASAGGLEAMRRLLSALPAQSGMGFILVPHLDPTRESRMVELLAGASAIPVTAAENGRRIRPDHVYVIPPNRLLTVHGGRLVLRPLPYPRAGSTALDLALRSLAADQGPNAVGIVLSGTGAHGASGLEEILRVGGLGLAQEPATAQYDQMPRGAMAAGVPPQHVLAPEHMGAVLLARARQLEKGDGEPATGSLRSTRLFHDAGALDALATHALASLVDRASGALPVRVWIPVCGTGEEAYSLTMLLLERLEAAGRNASLKVFATDPDSESLRVARLGIYPESIAETVSRERLARFFHLTPTRQYQVASELRQAVIFGRQDLFNDPPISRVDLLACRAPLCELRLNAPARLIAHLHFALNPGGYLLLGRGSAAVAASGLFETVSEQGLLYRKPGPPLPARTREEAITAREGDMARRPASRHVPAEGVAGLMDRALLGRLAPAAILMNVRYRILATRGPVTQYLRIKPRMPLPTLLTAAGASLRAATQSACEEAVRSRRWARHAGSCATRGGRGVRCSICARSFRSRASGEPLLLVIFEREDPGHRGGRRTRAPAARKIMSRRGLELPGEALQRSLQAILTDLERADDDLESTKEQMSAMNEELRSANEELQSSNEEMRAVNEELESAKRGLQERTAAAVRVEAQLRAVLDATVDAVVTIDAGGRILTFNGSASRMFGYALHEVIGRNVSMLLPPELRAHHDEYLAPYRKTRERHVIGTSREVIAYRRNGTRFPALLSVSEIADADLLVGCFRDLTQDKALQEEILHIAALEQQRIGQELHDGMQQELTGLGLLAQSLSEELARSGAAKAGLAKRLAAGVAEANRHVRALARGLVPVPIEAETLPAALGELARSTRETYKLSCRLECPVPLKMPDATTATHLYRIAQEAVGNAAKHAKADEVVIRLANDGKQLLLEIHDNGVGIPGQPPMNGGVGLRLMEHRCVAIGGRFMIRPRASGGTVVSCTVPFLGRA